MRLLHWPHLTAYTEHVKPSTRRNTRESCRTTKMCPRKRNLLERVRNKFVPRAAVSVGDVRSLEQMQDGMATVHLHMQPAHVSQGGGNLW